MNNYYEARDAQKGDLFQKLCKLCTSWEYNSEECRSNLTCKRCNCGHAKHACALQSLSNCAAISAKYIKLCARIYISFSV